MKKDPIETIAAAWTVDTQDLTARVAAAIGAAANPTPDLAEVLKELREIRRELADFQRTAIALQEELFHVRMDLKQGSQRRIDPYASTERFAAGW